MLTIIETALQDEHLAEDLLQELLAALAQFAVNKVVVDMQNLKYVTSVAFRPLLRLRSKLQETRGGLMLCGLTKCKREKSSERRQSNKRPRQAGRALRGGGCTEEGEMPSAERCALRWWRFLAHFNGGSGTATPGAASGGCTHSAGTAGSTARRPARRRGPDDKPCASRSKAPWCRSCTGPTAHIPVTPTGR